MSITTQIKQQPIQQQFEPQQYKQDPSKQKSKKFRKYAVVIVVIIVLIASIAYFFLRKPEEEEKKITIYDVSKIRGLDVLEEVPIRYLTEEELRDYINESIGTEDIEELEKLRLAIDSLFLLDYDENLTRIILDSYHSQVLGFYNTEKKEIVLVEGSSSIMDRVTLSHEFTHALQDQHFDLKTFNNVTEGDEPIAREAVAEGDATLTMSHYLMTLSNDEMRKLLRESEEASGSTEELPYAIEQMMLFSYQYGLDFIQELYDDGGWDSVNDAYNNPPTSTEQVMHIEKYYKKESPLNVSFEPEIQNMTLIFNDTMGEFIIYIMLDHYISSYDAALAAGGWGGDRFYYYQNETDFLSVFKIEWDNGYEATQFYSTYIDLVSRLSGKYKQAWINNCLEIIISQNVTTIYYSSNQYVIDGIGR